MTLSVESKYSMMYAIEKPDFLQQSDEEIIGFLQNLQNLEEDSDYVETVCSLIKKLSKSKPKLAEQIFFMIPVRNQLILSENVEIAGSFNSISPLCKNIYEQFKANEPDPDYEFENKRLSERVEELESKFSYFILSEKDSNAPEDFIPDIFEAIRKSRLDFVEYIIKKQPDMIHIKDPNTKLKPLHFAALEDQIQIFQFLISEEKNIASQKGIECNPIDTRDEYGRTPIFYAIMKSNFQTLNYILTQKPNVYIQDSDHLTPLHYAIQYRVYYAIMPLIKINLSVLMVKDNEGVTPLHYLANIESAKYLRMIKALNAHISHYCFEIQDCNGRTPLHYAANSGNLGYIKYVIEQFQIDPFEQIDHFNNSVLYYASDGENPNQELVDYLRSDEVSRIVSDHIDQTVKTLQQVGQQSVQRNVYRILQPSQRNSQLPVQQQQSASSAQSR